MECLCGDQATFPMVSFLANDIDVQLVVFLHRLNHILSESSIASEVFLSFLSDIGQLLLA